MTHFVCDSYSHFRLLALSGQNLDEFVIFRCLTELVTLKWLTMCVCFLFLLSYSGTFRAEGWISNVLLSP